MKNQETYDVTEREIGQGFFNMNNVIEIQKMNLIDAKNYLLDIVKASNARDNNITKIKLAIEKAKNLNNLSLTISNFILAHPSENLKLISI